MKVRKLAVALALAGGLGSGMANALGLGEIELQSWLNEPLDAEISLRQSQGVNPADVYVNVAPEAAYERVGLDRNQFLSKLRFNVVTAPDGGLRIDVSSREPLREPYLNFLLELTWPNGRLMREYAVLVDPPVYAEESGLEEPVSAPASTSTEPAPQRSAESLRRQAEIEGSVSRTYQSVDTFGPTGPSDTLWSIARQMRPDSSVSMHQMMLAIQEENPNAFIDGNINRLKRGQVLRVPSDEQMRSRSRGEADRLVAQQNEAFRSPAPAETATAEAPSPTDAQQTTGGGGDAPAEDSELKLLVADDAESETRAAEEGGSAGGDGDLPGGQDAGAAVAAEEMDALRRENQELDGRLQDLQEQVQTLQRLLELKDNQLADLQGMTAEQNAEAEQAETEQVAETEQAAPSGPSDEPAQSGTEADTETEVAMATGSSADDGPATEAEEQPSQPVQPAAPAQKPFPGNIIDAIMTNPLYQIALGGGLILLLLLLLLARRRQANKEKEFFEQFADEEAPETADSGAEPESVDGVEASVESDQPDAIAEADKYLGYGQYPQAAQVLESAISREPSRSDLRLKLLGVYADSQDAGSFDKQYNELVALEDEDATARADELRNRMQEEEAGPSIDDLESQLRSDPSEAGSEDTGISTEPAAYDLETEVAEETDAGEESMEFDLSLADLESEDEDLLSGSPESGSEAAAEEEKASEEDSDLGSLEFDLESFENEGETVDKSESEEDFGLEFESGMELEESPELQDLGSEFEETESEKPADEEATSLEDELSVGPQSLDDSFLDDLDAELDKVSGDDQPSSESEDNPELTLEQDQADEPEAAAESEEDDFSLDMDLSEEDLAIMDELSDEGDIPSLDEEVGKPDAEQELTEPESDESETPEQAVEPEAEAPQTGKDEPASALDLDESDLGDDDDFDFLAGTDEAATKLDLARAYVEMGDSDGARDILEEVALEGNDEQKAEAQELLKNLS